MWAGWPTALSCLGVYGKENCMFGSSLRLVGLGSYGSLSGLFMQATCWCRGAFGVHWQGMLFLCFYFALFVFIVLYRVFLLRKLSLFMSASVHVFWSFLDAQILWPKGAEYVTRWTRLIFRVQLCVKSLAALSRPVFTLWWVGTFWEL